MQFVRIVCTYGQVRIIEGPGTEDIVVDKSSETEALNMLGAKGFKPYLVSEEDTHPWKDATKVVRETTFRLSRTVKRI